VIKFNAPGRGHSLFEISTSPLSMFYIPFIRTLLPRSATTVERTVRLVTHDANGTAEVTETEEEVPAEVVLNYTPVGNYKWCVHAVEKATQRSR
jgi:alkaline phosphatase D